MDFPEGWRLVGWWLGEKMKRWEVDCSTWTSGHCKRFWLKRSALRYAEKAMTPFVDLCDLWNGEKVRLKETHKELVGYIQPDGQIHIQYPTKEVESR